MTQTVVKGRTDRGNVEAEASQATLAKVKEENNKLKEEEKRMDK